MKRTILNYNISIAVHSIMIFIWSLYFLFSGINSAYLKDIAYHNRVSTLTEMSFSELGEIKVDAAI